MSMFKNGNRRVARLMIWELGAGCLLMAIMQIQGYLPSQDWLSPEAVKKWSFALALFGTLLKSVELFFSKTAAMFKNHDFPDDLDDPVTTTTTTTTTATAVGVIPAAIPPPPVAATV